LNLRCVLINPWVYDFAAMNLWSRPLGLLRVAEYMSQFDVDIKLVDCMDIFKSRIYGTGKYPREIVEKPQPLRSVPRYFKRYGISINDFIERFRNFLPCDFIYVTSLMSYWYPGIQKAIEIVRTISPHTPIILGGIYATLYHEHAVKHSGADFIYKGHIRNDIVSVLGNFGLRLNNPLTFKKNTKDNKNHPLPPWLRVVPTFSKGGDLFPSLAKRGEGRFYKTISSNRKRYYKLNLYQSYPFAPVLTSLGCPYDCSYCASKILFNGFVQREPSNVINEIKELYTIGVRDFAFYDDALLVNADSHIKIILKEIMKSGFKVRFHCPNGIHAIFIDDELAYLMKESGFITLRLGLETISSERQARTGGKVNKMTFTTAVKRLKNYGFTKNEISTYLMYGLPGQGLEEVKEGVKFLKDLGVRINLTEFSPIPGTLCWQELNDRGLITNDIDPLLTNNTVFSYLFSGYDLLELEKLKLDVKQYNSHT
jgi:radical SAM superfamily enzyme YgiQ (UPF0313 family)